MLPTSKRLTLMYSQTRVIASDWGISLPPVPKNLARASDITTGDDPRWTLSVVDSTSTFNRLAWLDSSAHIYKWIKMTKSKASQDKNVLCFMPHHILVGSSAIICLASNLFILDMSVQSVSKTTRRASSQIIFLLLLGSWRLFFLMYAHSCFTICIKQTGVL